MTMAAAIESRTAETPARSRMSRIASVDILGDLGQAEPVWRGLEDIRQFSTPYQRFDFLEPWQRQVGAREGLRPFIVIAYDAERRPLLLLPLTLGNEHGVRTASFMGGKHATFNMALWDREFAAGASTADLEALVSAIRERSEADVLALSQQPLTWRDLPNPMALLPHQASANDCPLMKIVPEEPPTVRISSSFRRRLKGKERKLQALPGYRSHVATTDADVKRLFDWFFLIKPQRMAEQKLPNVFADPGVEEFIRDACMAQLADGVNDGHRFSMMFNTYTLSANAKYSPGLILMRDIVDRYAARGYRALDLGIGSDDYKRLFCKDDEPIFDSFIPLGLRGKLAAAAMSSVNRAKHLVKHNPALFELAQRLRGAFQR